MNNRFVFVAPHYNASRYVGQMLMSIGAQSYKNWRIIITDDRSDIFERQELHKLTSHFRDMVDPVLTRDQFVASKVELIINEEKKWEIRNVLEAVRKHCDPDDIVCRIDCDDYLCDNDALTAINAAYARSPTLDALWTAHRWIDTQSGVDVPTNINISGELTNLNPYRSAWRSSHLKTFRAGVLSQINEENFKGSDGEYGTIAGDQALYLPVLYKARKVEYLPMVTYAYRCSLAASNFQSDYAHKQKSEAEFIRERGFVE